MNIIYQDEHFFVIDKPAGFFVHPPEASAYPTPREKICLYHLQKSMNRAVYPVHRLDAPTSGLVVFAFSKESTRELSRLFADREIKKTYHAVTRGFVEENGRISIPLEIKGFKDPISAETNFKCLAKLEVPQPVGKKYPSARYSLVEIQPTTGRWHQIRRHFDRTAHPILGDIEHGDSHHNRFFRDHLKIPGLCLRAKSLSFTHPWTQRGLRIDAPECEKWLRIFSLFDYT
jgi:tRNA pseudouridine65 synthase